MLWSSEAKGDDVKMKLRFDTGPFELSGPRSIAMRAAEPKR